MTAIVNVFLKDGVLDPQGKAAHHALDSLGLPGEMMYVSVNKLSSNLTQMTKQKLRLK